MPVHRKAGLLPTLSQVERARRTLAAGLRSGVAPHGLGAILACTVALAAGAASAAQLTLDWVDNSGGTAGFVIERRTGTTGAFGQIATTEAGVTSYVDSTVPAGATFCYRVRASNAGGTSGSANVACGTAAASGPDNTSTGPAPAIALAFAGVARDRVSQSGSPPAPDGVLDGIFTLTLAPGSGARILTRLELRRHDSPDPWEDVWDTVPTSAFWTLGVAGFPDGQLLNDGSGINVPLAAGASLTLFAADVEGLFVPGSSFTITATFADGSMAIASTTTP
jgi:hypothetical protein